MNSQTACPEEVDLLARAAGEELAPEVESHVEGCAQCQQRMRRLNTEMARLRSAAMETTCLPCASSTAHDESPPAPAVEDDWPASIGKYRVLGVLGRGGQSIVYRVVDSSLERDLVVKMPRRPPRAAAWDRQRLVAEGRVLAQIDHPNVARVIDLDFHEDQPYLVMEYVRGRNLRQYVAGRRLPPLRAAALVAQVARAMAAAHALGITHQDLKPENIVIDETGRPRIIDFGLARLRWAWQEEREQPEFIGGSIPYMAPEQARGDTENIGPQTDIFGLGAVLYELLVGHARFEGADPRDALRLVEEWAFDRGTLESSGAPARLVAVCSKAMAADPRQRYPDVEQFARDLERAVRPRRGPIVLLALAAIVVLAAAVTWFAGKRVVPAPARAQYLVNVAPDAPAPVWIDRSLPAKQGAPFRIECDVPLGFQASVFWYDDAEGKVQEMEGSRKRLSLTDGSQENLVGPRLGFDGKAGVEVVLVCANRRDKPSLSEVEAVLREVLGKAGALKVPPFTMLVMTGDRVAIPPSADKPRGFRKMDAPDDIRQLLDRFDKLRQKLRERYSFVAGVVFPYELDLPEGQGRP